MGTVWLVSIPFFLGGVDWVETAYAIFVLRKEKGIFLGVRQNEEQNIATVYIYICY